MAKINEFDAVAAKKAGARVASKTSKNSTTNSTSTNSNSGVNTGGIATRPVAAIAVPGLTTILPDSIAGMMPAYDVNAYHISDPLNPPENAPQATKAQVDKGLAIYEGMQGALKLTGGAFDTAAENFRTFGKYAKAYGAGIQATTEVEKVKGNYLDYLKQTEVTLQKSTGYSVAMVKTDVDASTAVHTETEMTEKLEQARVKAETASVNTMKAQGELNTLKGSLGAYLSQSK